MAESKGIVTEWLFSWAFPVPLGLASRSQASEDLGTQLRTSFGVWDGAAIVVLGSVFRAALAGRHPSLVINCLTAELRWL